MATNNSKHIHMQETHAEDKERIQELENEITRLQSSHDVLSRKYSNKCIENGNLLGDMEKLEEISDEQTQTIKKLQNEKKALCKKIKELKEKLDAADDELNYQLQKLRQKGKNCDRNCVLGIVHWICEEKLPSVKVTGCERQLDKILTHFADNKGIKVEKEDLKCEKFMEILRKCGIVHVIYEDDKSDMLKIIDEVWKQLMSMNEGLCFLGIKSAGIGHCIICDLDARITDGLLFYDPQRDENAQMNKKEFTDYLNDPNVVGLNLHIVNLQKLEEIIKEHHEVLHLPSTTKQMAL